MLTNGTPVATSAVLPDSADTGSGKILLRRSVSKKKFPRGATGASTMEKMMKDMEINEIEAVDGGMISVGLGSAGLALAIGSASFGAGWGAVGVGLAFAASPLTVVALGGLALYAGYQLASH